MWRRPTTWTCDTRSVNEASGVNSAEAAAESSAAKARFSSAATRLVRAAAFSPTVDSLKSVGNRSSGTFSASRSEMPKCLPSQ